MKKLKLALCLACTLLVASVSEVAQAQTPLNFGIKGGLNISNLSGDLMDDYDHRVGLTIGAVVDISIPLSPVGVETGVYYSQKGAAFSDEFNINGDLFNFDGTFKLDYLEVPILAKVNFGPPGPLGLHVVAGPYVSYLLNAEYDESINGGTETYDVSDDIEPIDIGLTGGLGVDFNLGLTKLNVQARYSMGMLDVEDGMDYKNRVISVVAGFTF